MAITRNAGATYFIPSENEWYKAAYFNPSNSTYWTYPTQSNIDAEQRAVGHRDEQRQFLRGSEPVFQRPDELPDAGWRVRAARLALSAPTTWAATSSNGMRRTN